MKKINNTNKSNLFKKLFIKLCRLFGFEILDQANFSSPTLNKKLNQTLSIQGKKSITLPLGQIEIKRKISSLKIILRTCTSELIMDQNKKRLFGHDKNEYTFRTLRSLIRSVNKAKVIFDKIKFDIVVTDTNSSENDIIQIKKILESSNIEHKFISINLKEFENKIKPGYSKAKFANMANFYNSLFNKYGYSLICISSIMGHNAFFVKNEYLDYFREVPKNIEDIYITPNYWSFSVNFNTSASKETVENIFRNEF